MSIRSFNSLSSLNTTVTSSSEAFMDDGICCAQCDIKFDDSFNCPYRWPSCDHLICKSCFELSTHLWPKTCPVCNNMREGEQFSDELLSRVFTCNIDRAVGLLSERMFTFPCNNCETLVRQEKLRICVSCANDCGVAVIEATSLEKMLRFVYCADCSIDSHLAATHKMTKFHPWKNSFDTHHLNLRIVETQKNAADSIARECERAREAEKKMEIAFTDALSFSAHSSSAKHSAILRERISILSQQMERAVQTVQPQIREFDKEVKMVLTDLSALSQNALPALNMG